MNRRRQKIKDYETVTRSRKDIAARVTAVNQPFNSEPAAPLKALVSSPESSINAVVDRETFLKRGHVLSFAALFAFTVVLYARPAEFYPSALTNSLALVLGAVTLVLFGLTQVSLEGTLTARPFEVNLVLLFALTGLLSIPLAIDPAPAWNDFSTTFIRGIATFIVIINVVRTERRLKALLFLAVATAVVLSFQAINAYRLGLMTVEGYRAAGMGTGIFANTNDMALHLVTMLPISIACFFGSRAGLWKVIHALCAAVIISGIFLSYSRGAFLGMLVVFGFFALKLRHTNKLEFTLLMAGALAAILVLAPTGYGSRLVTIFMPELDASGSADSRRGELFRSIYVALRHPLLGIGMGNYQPNMSYRGLVTHNSYTQVACEMGLTALVIYTMFIVSPLRKLAKIVRETLAIGQTSPFYYLGLGLQASLLVFMVTTFFLSVPYQWNVYYLIGYAVSFRRIYESATGKLVVVEKRKGRARTDPSRTAVEAAQPATA